MTKKKPINLDDWYTVEVLDNVSLKIAEERLI